MPNCALSGMLGGLSGPMHFMVRAKRWWVEQDSNLHLTDHESAARLCRFPLCFNGFRQFPNSPWERWAW